MLFQKIIAGKVGSSDLWVWGVGTEGALGQGTVTHRSSPVQVPGTGPWSSITGGSQFSLGVKGGTLWAWGENNTGQLGVGDVADRSSPVQVGALADWSRVQAVYDQVLAIKTDGTLWSWGANGSGQLGLGNAAARSSPEQVGTLTTWGTLSVAGHGTHSLALQTNGTLWAWGYNSLGQLGLGNRGVGNATARSSPVQVGTLTTWAYATILGIGSVALKTDGTLWAWGSYAYTGAAANRSSPVQVGTLADWFSIGSGLEHVFGIRGAKPGGTLWAWGSGQEGARGSNNTTLVSSPVQVGTLGSWSVARGGLFTSAALKDDGTLWAWGANASGQSGLGNTVSRSSPVQVGTLAAWAMLELGTDHGIATHL